MSVRAELIKLVIFVLVAIGVLWLLWSILLNSTGGDTKSYTAQFTDASGLHEGDNVRIAGVRVGRVDSMKLVNNHCDVTISIKAGQPIFQNTRAEIRYQNLIGQRYIAMVPGQGPAIPLSDGATIPLDRTQPSFDLSVLLNGFQPLFSVLKPSDLNQLSESLLQVMQGSETEIGPFLQQLSQATNSIADRDQILGAVITNLNQVLGNLSRKTPQFYALLDQGQRLVTGLNAHRNELFDSLDRLSSVTGKANHLLSDITPNLNYDITNTRKATDVFMQHKAGLRKTLITFPDFLGSVARITQYGSFINLYACSLSIGLLPNTPPIMLGTPNDPHSEVCR